MPKSKSIRRRLYEQIEHECNAALKAQGRVDLVDVINRVVPWAEANRDVLEARRIVTEAVNRYDESRRPRMQSAQLGFFDADALVPVAEGVRVRMEDLTPIEFDAWWAIETDEHIAGVQVYAAKGTYYRERRRLMTNGMRLGTVEEQHFGWVRPLVVEQDDGDTDPENEDS